MLHTLIQNGTLLNGSVLFWDEPEANLNPALMKVVVDILLALQRQGIQIFIATHDYVFLKWLAIKILSGDKVTFNTLHRDETSNEIVCSPANDYNLILHNPISQAFALLYDADLMKGL